MSAFQDGMLLWTRVYALAAAGTLVVFALAAFFTYRQIKELARARRLQSALSIFGEISSPDLRNARRLVSGAHDKITEKVTNEPALTWPDLDAFLLSISANRVDLDCFHSYLAALENIAMLVMHDLAPDDLVEMYLGRMAPQHWERLGPFIRFMRTRYQSDDFLQHFELMTQLMAADALRLQGVSTKQFYERFLRYIKNESGREKRRLLQNRRAERARQDTVARTAALFHHTEGD